MRIGRYLLGSKDRGVVFSPDPSKGLEVFVDADLLAYGILTMHLTLTLSTLVLDLLSDMLDALSFGRVNFKQR